MDKARLRVLLLPLGVFGAGCMGPHDTVLMADEPASAMMANGGVGGGKTPSGDGSSGMNGATTPTSSPTTVGVSASSGGSGGSAPMKPMSSSDHASNAGAGGATGGTGSSNSSADNGMTSQTAGTGGGGAEAGASAPTVGATDADCDFSGVWMLQQLTVSVATGVGVDATSNNWYFVEFQQSGDDVLVSNEFDCGIDVEGTVKVTISKQTLIDEMPHNRQTGRKATLKKVDGKCAFDAERFWSVRGAVEDRFLPTDGRASMMSIADVEKARPLPTANMPDGAIDTENDGQLGIAFQASGIISGTRNSVQRDWTRWFTDAGYEITPAMDWTMPLKVRADFDNEENVLDTGNNDLLRSGSTPKAGAKHELRLRFLGRSRSDSRAMAIIKSADVDTCYAIQDAMPAEELK